MESNLHFSLNGNLPISLFGLEEDQERLAVPDSLQFKQRRRGPVFSFQLRFNGSSWTTLEVEPCGLIPNH